MTGVRGEYIATLSRQQRRRLHREAEKRGQRFPPMSSFEARSYHAAGELTVTEVWALTGKDLVDG